MKFLRYTRFALVALCLCLLPSCSLISSLLKIPVGILKTVGRTAGIGLTDDAAQPVSEAKNNQTIEESAAQRLKESGEQVSE